MSATQLSEGAKHEGAPVGAPGLQHNPIRHEWLATRTEDAIDPALPVVDSHHHLFDRPGNRYLFEDMLADLRCGHDVRATVYVQGRGMHRADGPEAMRPVGETEFANGVAAMCASGAYGDVRMCAGIVGTADLRLGDAVRPVLEAHVLAGGGPLASGGRFRGIRDTAAWDPDPSLVNPAYKTSEDMLATPEFRAGFAHLAPLGLSFDAWIVFHQIPRLAELARAFPDTQIVLDHCGGIHGVGRFAGRRQEVFTQWKRSMADLATCPNVMVKLGGLGMKIYAFGFEDLERAPSSEALGDAWRPWVETCVETFGTARCMWESNFCMDKGTYSYGIGLNAMKRIFTGASLQERADVFWRSATQFYQLGQVPTLSGLSR